MKKFAALILLAAFTAPMGGCLLAAAAGGGYMVADEIKEKDGKFDPLEDVRGKGDGQN